MLLGIEMGLTSPVFRMLLFIMPGIAPKGTEFGDVIEPALPCRGCDAILVALLIAFPAIALYLPLPVVR